MAKETERVGAPSPVPREKQIQWRKRERDGLERGIVVVKGKKVSYEMIEQGFIRWLSTVWMEDTASNNMTIFIHRIPAHSGKHVHQGGFSLFVIEGKGYTVVDGVRHNWEEGDLILLPIKAGGVEHQHFNLDPQKPSRWLALTSNCLWPTIGRQIEQREYHPDWKGPRE